MNIKLINVWGPSEDNFGFQISANDLLFGDTLRYEGAGVKIVPSKNDSFYISVVYSSRGDNRVDAERYARSIGVDVAQMDSTITVNKQIHISSKDKFRVQRAVVVIMVPEGKQIIFSSNDPDEYDDGDTDYDFEDVDMSKNKNNSSVREYIMRKDGLYTPEGKKSKPVFFD